MVKHHLNKFWRDILFITMLHAATNGFGQIDDYVYFQNFVYHADGKLCTHQPPSVSFVAYLNQDLNKILTDRSPRWRKGADPNITGKGVFGIELGNFIDPAIKVGDTVSVRFTCNATQQQGTLTEVVSSIPWYRFPATLQLVPAAIPESPQNVTLNRTAAGYRCIKWQALPGLNYMVYRRSLADTLLENIPRMLYIRIGEHVVSDSLIDSTASIAEKYGYLVFAVSSNGIWGPPAAEVNEAPVINFGDDLTIGYISRLPKIDYVWGEEVSRTDGWPKVGQIVTWRAHLKNWMMRDLKAVKYQWYLDGAAMVLDSIDLPAGKEVTVDYPWTWTFDRHVIKFVIDPKNEIPEEEEKNNQLSIFTDAIAVGFYVEQSVYEYFRRYQRELRVHSNCWEDWAQRQVSRWNQMFAAAIYPESPNGVLDRIRIDEIVVVPDGALPLAGGSYPTNMPNLNDRTVDLQWGFTAEAVTSGFYANHTSPTDNNPFYFEGSLIHELGHARYLIDLYGFNVHDDRTGKTVAIKENGKLIVGTNYMPMIGSDAVYYCQFQGLMNSNYTYIDRYSAAALNLIAGYRARLGNYNAPGNIGVFMQDLPAQNRLTVMDASGNKLPGASVWIYQATGNAGQWYGKYFDDIPDLKLLADANGQVLLGRCPFSKTGRIEHTYGFSNGVIILRVAHEGKVGYGFLESTLFNLQYWSGHTNLGDYELKINLIPTTDVDQPPLANLPNQFVLNQNYPNPFNSITKITYQLPANSHVSLAIYDVNGQIVEKLIQEDQTAGSYQYEWRASVASGIYFCKLVAKWDQMQFADIKKMVLIK